MPCMRGLAVAISSRFTTPSAVSRIAWTSSGFFEAGLGLELRQQPVDVVDVPRALDLGDHDHVELVADLGDELGEVVEHPGAVEAVDARPELRVAEVDLLADLDQPLARGDLAVGRDRVLEVAEQDVGLLRHVGHLRRHLLVRGVEEMDHPRGLERDLAWRVRRADRQGLEEVAGVPHGAREISPASCRLGQAPNRLAESKGGSSERGPMAVATELLEKTDEQRAITEMVRQFVDEQIIPTPSTTTTRTSSPSRSSSR